MHTMWRVVTAATNSVSIATAATDSVSIATAAAAISIPLATAAAASNLLITTTTFTQETTIPILPLYMHGWSSGKLVSR